MAEQHKEELLKKDEEILKLQGDIRRMEEEVEKEKEKVESLQRGFDSKKAELAGKFEEEVKRAGDAKLALEEERSRLKEFTTKLVALEGDLKRTEDERASMRRKHREDISKAYQAVEEKDSELAAKEGRIVNLQSELTRTKLAAATLEQEKAIIQSKYDEDKSELESRRKEARAFDLKHAKLGVTLEKASKDADNLAVRIRAAALLNTNLNIRERGLAAREAELAASQTHFDLLVQEERRRIRADIEAELDTRFKAVEKLEEKERYLVEREKQCSLLHERVSEKTAEMVLAKEGLFAERTDGTLCALISEFTSLCNAIDAIALVPIPSGQLDDAKNGEGKKNGAKGEGKMEGKDEGKSGEGEKEAEGEEAEKPHGKGLVVFQEEPKEKSKLLASSMAAAARSSSHVAAQIEVDVVLATTLQMEQAFELMEKGVTKIPLVQPLQKMPSQAAPSSSGQASVLAAPAAKKPTPPPAEKKMPPQPPPPAPKSQPKRAAPTEQKEDPKAKRQKIQKEITAKASRLEEKKKEEEERRKKSEKQEKLRLARTRKVEERAANL